jgi:GTP pyrophosphokinase
LKIYSIVTDHYRPSPSRLRDWYPPKSTGYEALHVNGTKRRWVEVQVANVWMRLQRKDMQHNIKNGATQEGGLMFGWTTKRSTLKIHKRVQ